MAIEGIVYYRTRPSEPAASDLALAIQRAKVDRFAKEHKVTLITEFVENEDQLIGRKRPQFKAAVRALRARKKNDPEAEVLFVVASRAGIGSGEPFVDHDAGPTNDFGQFELNALTSPGEAEIDLPSASPAGLSLWGMFRPKQQDTLIYLCNGGTDKMLEVEMVIDCISMHQFFQADAASRWAEIDNSELYRCGVLLPAKAVLIYSLSHTLWDFVNRYRLGFKDSAERRWQAEADDFLLNADCLSQNPDAAWVSFKSLQCVEPKTA